MNSKVDWVIVLVVIKLTGALVEELAAFTGQLILLRNGVNYFRGLVLCQYRMYDVYKFVQ